MEWDTMAEVEDKRIRRTKKLLRQALTRLMQQKDFQSITVTDVVREADINRGTFYAHYRDVYDLRDKIETGMIEDFRGMIAAIRWIIWRRIVRSSPHSSRLMRRMVSVKR